MEPQQTNPPQAAPATAHRAPRNPELLLVRIMSAEQSLYDSEAKAVSSVNETGKFDVLPFHANFISIVIQNVAVHDRDGSKKEFPIEIAVMKVLDNEVVVFLGIERADFITEAMPGLAATTDSSSNTVV
ncbi:MAG: hypothetical protein N2691_02990 [Patescibacteria group bacterium]|nr:hypothetical protein [Patescibacteria group bacterium]